MGGAVSCVHSDKSEENKLSDALQEEAKYDKSQIFAVSRAKRHEESGAELVDKARNLLISKQSAFDADTYQAIWSGDFDKLQNLSLNKSMVRIFTSSTFVDTKDWRNELMTDVYPFLQDICAILGLDFRIVDMRWGVRESTSNDHGTSDLCFSEIFKCQELSLGPSFVTFLGDRYGYRPFPRVIQQDEMKLLLNAIDNEHERDGNENENEAKELIRKWYYLNENQLPAAYILQPVSTHYPDFINNTNPELQKIASGHWWKEFECMQLHLRKAAIITDIPSKRDFITSVTNEEVRLGIVMNKQRNETTYTYLRDLYFDNNDQKDQERRKESWERINLKEMKEEYSTLAPYSDWFFPTGKLDQEAFTLQQQLKHQVLPNLSNKEYQSNCYEFPLAWNIQHTGYTTETYKAHLRLFLNHFTSTIGHSILTAYQKYHVQYSEYCEEVLHHTLLLQDKAKQYLGGQIEQEDIFEKALTYLGRSRTETDESSIALAGKRIFVIHGESGSGKTTLLSKLTIALQQHLRPSLTSSIEPTVAAGETIHYNFIIRFLGTTSLSGDVKSLLISLISQMSAIYEPMKYAYDEREAWETLQLTQLTYEELVKLFYKQCRLATVTSPLVIILDSLDQLSDDYNGRELTSWLPLQWKSSAVFIFVSCVPSIGPSYGTLCTTFQRETASEQQTHWYECKPYNATRCLLILQQLMQQSKYTLQSNPDQLTMITDCIYQIGSPLYITLAFQYIYKHWFSFTPTTLLPVNTKLLIEAIFEALEYKHGYLLVSHALGYITCCCSTGGGGNAVGISEKELEDILSCDEEVLQDVFQWWIPPIRRLPSLLWLRIRNDLGSYLVEKGNASSSGNGSNGVLVYSWYHRQFHEVAEQRYLHANQEVDNRIYKQDSIVTIRHTMLANYYAGLYDHGIVYYDNKLQLSILENRYLLRTMKSCIISDTITIKEWDVLSTIPVPTINTRKLYCQCYHEIRAGLLAHLLDYSIGNVEYIIAKTTFGKQYNSFQQDIVEINKLISELQAQIIPLNTVQQEQITLLQKITKFILRNIHQMYIPCTRWTQMMIDDTLFYQDVVCKTKIFDVFYTHHTSISSFYPSYQRQCYGLFTQIHPNTTTTVSVSDPRLLTIHTPTTSIQQVMWLPDETRVLVIAEKVIYCYDIMTGKELFQITQVNARSVRYAMANQKGYLLYFSSLNYTKSDPNYDYHYKVKLLCIPPPNTTTTAITTANANKGMIQHYEEVLEYNLYEYFHFDERLNIQINSNVTGIYLLQHIRQADTSDMLLQLDIVSIAKKGLSHRIYFPITNGIGSHWFYTNSQGDKIMYFDGVGNSKQIYYYDLTACEQHQEQHQEEGQEVSIIRNNIWCTAMQPVTAIHKGQFCYPQDSYFIYSGSSSIYLMNCIAQGELQYHIQLSNNPEFYLLHKLSYELYICDGSSDQGYQLCNYGHIPTLLTHYANDNKNKEKEEMKLTYPIIRKHVKKQKKKSAYSYEKKPTTEEIALDKLLTHYFPIQITLKKLFFNRDYLRSYSIDYTNNLFYCNGLTLMLGYSLDSKELLYRWENDHLGFTLVFNTLFHSFLSVQDNNLMVWDLFHAPKMITNKKEEGSSLSCCNKLTKAKTPAEKEAVLQAYYHACCNKMMWLSDDGKVGLSIASDIEYDGSSRHHNNVFILWSIVTGVILDVVYNIPTVQSIRSIELFQSTSNGDDVSDCHQRFPYWFIQYTSLEDYKESFLVFHYTAYHHQFHQELLSFRIAQRIVRETQIKVLKSQKKNSYLYGKEEEDEEAEEEEEEEDMGGYDYEKSKQETKLHTLFMDNLTSQFPTFIETTLLYQRTVESKRNKDRVVFSVSKDYSRLFLGIGWQIDVHDNTSLLSYAMTKCYTPIFLISLVHHISFIEEICCSYDGMKIITKAGNQDPYERAYEFVDLYCFWDLTTITTTITTTADVNGDEEEDNNGVVSRKGGGGLTIKDKALQQVCKPYLLYTKQQKTVREAHVSICISSQGTIVARILANTTILVSSFPTGDTLYTLNTYSSLPGNLLCFVYPHHKQLLTNNSANEPFLLGKFPDGTMKLWNTSKGELVNVLQSNMSSIGMSHMEKIQIDNKGDIIVNGSSIWQWNFLL